MAKRSPGRTPKLSKESQEAIFAAMREGMPRKLAAVAAGVADRTVRFWIQKGKKGLTPLYTSFLAGLKKAEADFVAEQLATIKKASKKNWTASAWMLERMMPEVFASERATIKRLQKEIDLLRAGKGTASEVEAFISRIANSQNANAPASIPQPEKKHEA